jgi:hypothetical protein
MLGGRLGKTWAASEVEKRLKRITKELKVPFKKARKLRPLGHLERPRENTRLN